MLWIKVKVGESVFIDDQVLTLVSKDERTVRIKIAGEHHTIRRRSSREFPTFTLYAGNNRAGLRLGFDAPESVRIRREKIETQFPTE